MRAIRALLAVLAVVGTTPSAPAAADATESAARTIPASRVAPTATEPIAPVMIILDASGSMTNTDAPGPRIDAAKQAVVSLVTALPSGSPVGLMVYGTGTGSSDEEKAAGCQDVKQLVPIGPVDKPQFIGAVQDVTASGYTPMGTALSEAAAALPRTGPASIVLVSDGIDTCAPPTTCEVATRLKAADADLVINTAGFLQDAAASTELACVADAGGGTFRSATDGAGLTAVLQSQVDAALRPYIVAGIPITGTLNPAGAPQIAPGQYWDTLAAGGNATTHYSIRLVSGATANIASTVIPAALRGGGADSKLSVVTQLQDQQGNLCLPTEREGDSLLAGKVDPVTALISGVVGGPKWSKRCPADGDFVVAVTRDSPSTVPTRVETIVQLEQPVKQPDAPVATVSTGLPPPALAAGAATAGGASFNTAPAISTGSYSDTLSTGETRYYKVHLDWGQQLSYQVVVDKIDGLEHGSGYARTAIATPLRQELPLSSTSNAARGFGGPESVSMTGSTLVPVRYGNRDSDRSDIRPYRLAGDYYLSVGMSYPVDAVPYSTGISISVEVVGQADPGPQYEPAQQSETDDQTEQLTAPSPRPQSSAPSTAVAGQQPPLDTSPGGYPAWLWFAVAVAVAGVSAAGVAVVRRRPRPKG